MSTALLTLRLGCGVLGYDLGEGDALRVDNNASKEEEVLPAVVSVKIARTSGPRFNEGHHSTHGSFGTHRCLSP